MGDINQNLGLIDHDTEISIVANAVFFDLDILIIETINRFTNYSELPVDEIVKELIVDKGISEEEAKSMLNEFTLKYYNQETYHETEET